MDTGQQSNRPSFIEQRKLGLMSLAVSFLELRLWFKQPLSLPHSNLGGVRCEDYPIIFEDGFSVISIFQVYICKRVTWPSPLPILFLFYCCFYSYFFYPQIWHYHCFISCVIYSRAESGEPLDESAEWGRLGPATGRNKPGRKGKPREREFTWTSLSLWVGFLFFFLS